MAISPRETKRAQIRALKEAGIKQTHIAKQLKNLERSLCLIETHIGLNGRKPRKKPLLTKNA